MGHPGATPVSQAPAGEVAGGLLQPGVRHREVWAWAMYDFANSGYTTVVLTTVFSVYFVSVVAGQASWATLAFTASLSLSYLLVMLTMPGLGARADARAGKRRLLFTSTAGCVAATAALAWAGPGDIWFALALLACSNYAYCVGEAAIASFLPALARREALGRVSGWGWSFGYFGGMLTLALALWVVMRADRTGVSAPDYMPAILWLTAGIFMLAAVPAFVWLRERSTGLPAADIDGMWARLGRAWFETRETYPDFRRLLVCGACYQAGIAVVVTLAAVYATEAMGFTMMQTMLMIFVVNIAAAVGAFLFGYFQDRMGHRRALAITLCGWLIMVALAYLAVTPAVFWLAALVAGLCMGTSQSAGRAMVGVLAPAHRPAEFFGLWAFAVQLAAVVGPLSYGLITWVTLGNHRLALLCTGLFFVAGLIALRGLDMQRGQAAASA